MIRRPPRSTLSSSSAASDVYKRQIVLCAKFYPYTGTTTHLAQYNAALETLEKKLEFTISWISSSKSAKSLHKAVFDPSTSRNGSAWLALVSRLDAELLQPWSSSLCMLPDEAQDTQELIDVRVQPHKALTDDPAREYSQDSSAGLKRHVSIGTARSLLARVRIVFSQRSAHAIASRPFQRRCMGTRVLARP